MLTNPSPNARIPRALSRRRRLRRSVPGLLIGGAASMDVSQKLHGIRRALKRDLLEIGFRMCFGLDRAAIWPSYHYDALTGAARSVTSARARAADAPSRPIVARTSVDRSAVVVMHVGGR